MPWQIGENVYSGILNVATGNCQLVQPICGWAGIGGGLSLSLYFNSQSSRTDTPLGSKWSHGFSLRIIGTSPAIVVDGDGTETKFTLSGGNYTAPAGIYDRLVRNGDNTWTLTKKGGYGVYRFNASGVLTTITDNNNNVTTCAYSGGLLSSVTDPTNRAVTFGYTSGKLTSITDFEGRIRTLTYTGTQLTQVSDPVLSGVTYRTAFAYTSGNVTGVTNRLNKTWTFLYGAVNDLTRMTDPNGKIWNYAIAAPSGGGGARIALPTDPWPSDVVAVGDVTDPTSLVVQYGFDVSGRVSAIRGATDNRAVYSYDSANNQLSLQTDSGATWNWSYDTRGNALQVADPLNKITQMTYDAASRPLTVKDPLNNTTSYQYDSVGNRTQVTDPLSNATVTAYNASGLATQVTDPRGKVTPFLYDAYGNQTRVTDPLGNQTNFQFKNGNTDRVARRTDALGRITDYDYDTWGRQTGIRYITTNNPSILSVYDAEGHLTQSTDGTGTRTYNYDAWGRRVSMTDPMGNTQATYDNAGRLKTQTDVAGRTHTYNYDSYQRLTSVNEGSQTAQYTYTPDNKIASCVYPNGTRADYAYDLVGRLTNITHKRISNNSVIVGYTGVYDNAGRLRQVTETPSGAVTTYQYNDAGYLLREERTNDCTYLGVYTYDSNGNRLTALRSEGGAVSHNGAYSYDNASRLLQVVDAAISSTELYDSNNDGTLAAYPGPGYVRRLSYNEEGQLTSIHRDYGGGNAQLAYEYAYGADGNCRWKKDYQAENWTWFPCGVVCSAGQLVEKQSDLSGAQWIVSSTALFGATGVVCRNSEFLHKGLANASFVTTDSAKNITSSVIYDQFGVTRWVIGDGQSPVRFGVTSEEGLNNLMYLVVQARQNHQRIQQQVVDKHCERRYRRCLDLAQAFYNGCIVVAGILCAAAVAIAVACVVGCAGTAWAYFLCVAACWRASAAICSAAFGACFLAFARWRLQCDRWHAECSKKPKAPLPLQLVHRQAM